MSWKAHFSRFLRADPQRLHFAAHSHHPWPDASFAGHERAWLDAARWADLKWDRVFGELLPRAQAQVARVLSLPDPSTIAFAPSTHELVMRLLSCLPRPLRVLTTDGEFHSFARQLQRLEEDGAARVTRIAVEPFGSFAARWAEAAGRGGHDLAYLSQVFYNSGYAPPDLGALVAAVRDKATAIVVDGYHGFMARPTDLSALAGRIFYVAGGYKYAMAGEGACFMHCPPGWCERPPDTGWFASFGTLAHAQGGSVPYAAGGARFFGATFDPTALYRLVAVQDWLQSLGVDVARIRAHVLALQRLFLQARQGSWLGRLPLVLDDEATRGSFLVFRDSRAQELHDRLLQAGIVVDCRADRLRIGLGLHLDGEDVEAFFRRTAGFGPGTGPD